MEFYILFSICFLWCLSLSIKNVKFKNEIKQLSQNYDKLCDVLAGEINVEDVKKRLEGRVEQKALVENNNRDPNKFPLTLVQLNRLREEGKKKKGAMFRWETIKNSILPYTLVGMDRGELLLIINNKAWEILDASGNSVLMKWDLFSNQTKVSIILDPLQVQEILKNNE